MRLKDPVSGVVASVDEDYGKYLLTQGWTAADKSAPKKAPAKSEK